MDISAIAPVKYIDGKMLILDQTLLPAQELYIEMKTAEDIWEAIRELRVRGAPAIGIAAAYGVFIAVRDSRAGSFREFLAEFRRAKSYLDSARPTAVNLSWALARMEKRLLSLAAGDGGGPAAGPGAGGSKAGGCDLAGIGGDKQAAGSRGGAGAGEDWPAALTRLKAALLAEAERIRREDEEACRAMGEHGLALLSPGMGILTHCNAGTIATAKYGTCLAPLYLGQERGYGFRVFADETRPLLQGARLTAWELLRAGVDVTLICDNMASLVMKNGWIDAVVVGCDRMAANGDGANKIGTSGVAILAREYGIPFYMFAPTSTIDRKTKTGADIPLELREGEEIYRLWYEKPMAPAGVKTYNPAFDVTEAKYITAVVTEKGVIYPPYEEGLKKIIE